MEKNSNKQTLPENDFIDSVLKSLTNSQINDIKAEFKKNYRRPHYVTFFVTVTTDNLVANIGFMSEDGVYYHNWDENLTDFYLDLSDAYERIEKLGL